jgi:imidazolonepropionase-like amidohydrolase
MQKRRAAATATMFFALHNVGMPSLDIIRAVTTNAAELLGWRTAGAVELRKFADLIATAEIRSLTFSELSELDS